MTDSKKTDDRLVVAPLDGTDHGYIGYSPGADEDLTITAQVGGTANVSDVPKSETKTTTRSGKNTSSGS